MLATLVTMPETTVHEDRCVIFGQDYIWPTRKVLAMQAETIPATMEQLPEKDFGLRIGTPDTRHHLASFGSGHYIQWDLNPSASARFSLLPENPSCPALWHELQEQKPNFRIAGNIGHRKPDRF